MTSERSEAVKSTPKLLLVDGYSLVHRAFFALPPLQNAEGQPTHAVYGFLNMLLRLLEEEQPTHVVVAFDAGPTFRSELFADYKAHRPETPDDLKSQFPLVREALEALGIAVVEQPGYEADDVIGTLARQARNAGFLVVIVTGDKDLLQLVQEGVLARITRKGISELRTYDVEAVRREYQLEPQRLIDVKALMGDPSDNIPGVPGVGEKTALKLIRQFGDVDGVLENLDRVGGKKLSAVLRQYASVIRDSKRLATIVTDAPLTVDWQACRRREPDHDRARDLFGRLEFRSILDRLGIERVDRHRAVSGSTGDGVRIVRNETERAAVLQALQRAQQVGIVYRLAGPDARRDAVLWLAVATGEDAWLLLGRQGTGDAEGLAERSILEVLASALQRAEEGAARLTVHDLKPLLRRGVRSGFWRRVPRVFPRQFSGRDGSGHDPSAVPVLDTCVAAYLLDPSRSAYRVGDLARQLLAEEVPEPEDLLRSQGRRQTAEPVLARYDLDALSRVAGRQSRLLPALGDALITELAGLGMLELFREVEAPLTEVLAAMEHAGIAVDREALRAMGEEFSARIARLAEEIYALAGTEFNINSTQQLGEILFERLGLPVLKRTKTGYSTDAEVLEQLAPAHPIAQKVLEYRSLVKLMGTYVEGLLAEIEADGRIHTTFQQTVAATGRLASTSPNLQNIPIRDEPGRGLRRAFVAAPGHVLIAADYSQIELRVLAHMSKDERMLEAFRRGDDIHARTAAEVFGVALADVTPRMRSIAKAVNFGLIYGQTDFGLARQLGISRHDARSFIDRYFERYQGVQRFLRQTVKQAREQGYVRTLFGRIRYLPEINSRIFHRRSFAERTAMNTPIQGTAADIIKAAMVRVYDRLQREGRQAKLVLQVHDELILEVPEGERDAVAHLVSEEMAQAAELDVELVVDVKVGPNWYEMQPLESPHAGTA